MSSQGHEYSDIALSRSQFAQSQSTGEDLFCFYEIKQDIPLSVYKSLGDFSMATDGQREAIELFIFRKWPIVSESCVLTDCVVEKTAIDLQSSCRRTRRCVQCTCAVQQQEECSWQNSTV